MLSTAAAPSSPVEQLLEALDDLRDQIGGPYYLDDVDGRLEWPDRGVYFFFSPASNLRSAPAQDWRLSRIGTVGVSQGSSNTLWNRLRQHRGNVRGKYAGGGNHRGSIFRLHVGRALIEKHGWHEQYPHWGEQNPDAATTAVREQEHDIEQRVSEYIRELPFLWVDVPGDPGPECDRAEIEANTIAMVSHYRRSAGPSDLDWLGYHSPKSEVYQSGLWNVRHVSELYNPTVVDRLSEYVSSTNALAHQSRI
ncbi:hypothetical protein [Haloarcula salinisoli]|uniref:hypothetical protein n=1 Tax=Haloarcula salinisoli TaxID=2487746 RepID=UPI001F3DB5B0|nr:hypothetical protein [Halomicroarcula salinisoli]